MISIDVTMNQPNVFLDQSRAAIFLLKFFGLFPVQVQKMEEFKWGKMILSILYFISSYAFSMYISTRQMLRRSSIISSKTCDFDCLIFSTATLIVLVPTMLIPFAYWYHLKQAVMFWDKCYAFQVRYEFLVGNPMQIQIRKFINFYVIMSVIVVLLVVTLPSAFIAKFNFIATSTYYVVFGGFVAGVAYWLSGCLFLKQIADNILLFMNKIFTTWSIQRENAAICYELWATAQHLLKDFGNSMGSFLMIYGFSLMLTMLNAMYGFVSQLYTTELKTKNIKHAFGHFMLFMWSSMLIFVINESSYYVVNTVVEFYQIFRNTNSKLSFSGFNEFSRAFFITILGVIITYMVIMLQIRNDYLLSQKQMSITNTDLATNCTR